MIHALGLTCALGSSAPRCTESLVTPTILGGLHGIRAGGTSSFGVLASPGSASRAIGHCSFCSKTLSGTGSQVVAFIDSSTGLRCWHERCAVGLGPRSPSPISAHGVGRQPIVLRGNCTVPCLLNDQLGVTFHLELPDSKISRWTMYLNCSPIGVRSRTPAPAPYFHEEPSKNSLVRPGEDRSSGLYLTIVWVPWMARWRCPVRHKIS
jgi:hypothetical protein